jgi:L-ascorbate metabolism protein UlaG (beta-lactamase superfamily)
VRAEHHPRRVNARARRAGYNGSVGACDLTLRWWGHGTVLFDAGGLLTITDPVLGRWVGPLRRYAPPVPPDRYAGVRLVLVSHLHVDHLHLPSLRRLPADARLVGPRGAGPLLRRARGGRVTELSRGERTTVGAVTVTAVPAVHPGQRWRGRQHPLAPPVGYLVDAGARVYFAGDTDLFAGMADLRGRVDVALLPVGGWGLTTGPGHLDPARAAAALRLIRPQAAIPVHWGTLRPPGLRRVRRDLFDDLGERFARHAAVTAPEVRVVVLRPGTSTTLTLKRGGTTV